MKDQHDRLPDEAEIAAINARHLIDTPVKPADLLFVFGTREDVERRVDEAVRLWRDGYFRWAIVSGGITPGAPLSECAIIKPAMVARGIPAEKILEEHRALNTGENVIFSLPVIDAVLGLQNIRSVICLGNSWTARRYPMTLQRHWPEVEKMLVTVDPPIDLRLLGLPDPRGMLIAPRALHQHAPGPPVTGFGDRSALDAVAGGILRRHEPEIGHQLGRRSEPRESPISASSVVAGTRSMPRMLCGDPGASDHSGTIAAMACSRRVRRSCA